jgi:hypothetical protein
MPHHKVLRGGRNLPNMPCVRGREVRTRMYIKESLSHADDSQEEGEEEDDVEGGREAEGGEEDEEIGALDTGGPGDLAGPRAKAAGKPVRGERRTRDPDEPPPERQTQRREADRT